jgi:hypothetical protein
MTLSLICVCKMKTRFFFMCIEKTNKKYREYVHEAYSKVIEHCYERMEQTKVGTIGYKSHRFRKLWTLGLLFFCTYIESTGTRKYNRRRGTKYCKSRTMCENFAGFTARYIISYISWKLPEYWLSKIVQYCWQLWTIWAAKHCLNLLYSSLLILISNLDPKRIIPAFDWREKNTLRVRNGHIWGDFST